MDTADLKKGFWLGAGFLLAVLAVGLVTGAVRKVV